MSLGTGASSGQKALSSHKSNICAMIKQAIVIPVWTSDSQAITSLAGIQEGVISQREESVSDVRKHDLQVNSVPT